MNLTRSALIASATGAAVVLVGMIVSQAFRHADVLTFGPWIGPLVSSAVGALLGARLLRVSTTGVFVVRSLIVGTVVLLLAATITMGLFQFELEASGQGDTWGWPGSVVFGIVSLAWVGPLYSIAATATWLSVRRRVSASVG